MRAWRGRRVLVTGAGGFIGSRLAEKLAHLGALVRADKHRSGLQNPAAAARATRGIDVVFHLAAAPGGRAFVSSNPARVWDNILLDAQVIKAAAAARVSRFVFASSATVYPQPMMQKGKPLHEALAGPPFDPDGAFGWSKLTTERLLADCHREMGLRSVACRLFSVYGEGAPSGNAVQVWIEQALCPSPYFEIWGDGRQKRSWLHIDDAVSGLLLAADRAEDLSAVNLGGGKAFSVAETINLIIKLSGRKASLHLQPDRPAGAGHQIADISKARSLGWRPRVPLLEGLRRTLAALSERSAPSSRR